MMPVVVLAPSERQAEELVQRLFTPVVGWRYPYSLEDVRGLRPGLLLLAPNWEKMPRASEIRRILHRQAFRIFYP